MGGRGALGLPNTLPTFAIHTFEASSLIGSRLNFCKVLSSFEQISAVVHGPILEFFSISNPSSDSASSKFRRTLHGPYFLITDRCRLWASRQANVELSFAIPTFHFLPSWVLSPFISFRALDYYFYLIFYYY